MFTTLFCLYWDYNWDWGLFDRTLPGAPLLRDKLVFNPSTYYLAIIANTIFRFWWLLMAIQIKMSGPAFFLDNLEFLSWLSMTVEATRRTIWSILRVENEYFNNFENYRDYIAIPPIGKDKDEENID